MVVWKAVYYNNSIKLDRKKGVILYGRKDRSNSVGGKRRKCAKRKSQQPLRLVTRYVSKWNRYVDRSYYRKLFLSIYDGHNENPGSGSFHDHVRGDFMGRDQ